MKRLLGPRNTPVFVESLEPRVCLDARGPLPALLAAPQSAAPVRQALAPSAARLALTGPSESVTRGAEAAFLVTLTAAPGEGRTVRVNYATVDGGARAGVHYTRTVGSVEFTGSETSKVVTVPTLAGGTRATPKTESFGLQLSNARGAKITTARATAMLAPRVQGLAISNTTLEEGNTGSKTARVFVTLGVPSTQTVTVVYATADGSARADDGDYVSIPAQTLTFQPGETSKVVTIDVNGDTAAEANEVFFVNLSNAVNAPIIRERGTVSLRNDDVAPKAASEFQITIDYATTKFGTVPQVVRDAAEFAARRWSEVIVGDLPDVPKGLLDFTDDFRMTVGMGLLDVDGGTDGPSKYLADAGPLEFRRDGSKLPWLGITGIDPADTGDPELLKATLLHEFGHALGLVPAVWNARNLIQTSKSGAIYVGTNALRWFNTIYGANARGVPLEDTGGAGTVGAHWRDSVLKNELMTGIAEQGPSPLSRITVGALADLGYTVNYDKADPFARPPGVEVPDTSPVTGGTTGGTTSPRTGWAALSVGALRFQEAVAPSASYRAVAFAAWRPALR
jgi:hypothetical protein